jgi:TonB family protein
MISVSWKQWEGQVVDLYFPLRRYLGGTARSAVYLTQYGDPELHNAAIKLVLPESPESDPTARWQRVAQLSHPNLLRLMRTGRCQLNQLPVAYAVTEYADENLAEVLAERPLTPDEVREMLKPLLDALAYVHREGLVHGHLKPSNIMAVGDRVKLSVDGITLVGESGIAPATPGPYDPPEFQERGCSPVGDVWSFGVTLVEALTRQLPSASVAKQEPTLPEGISAEFLPIVRACLRVDPRRRASVAQILELFDHPGGVPVVGPQQILTVPPKASRRRMIGTVVACTAGVALAGIFVAPRLLHRSDANAQVQPATEVSASRAATPPVETPQPPKPTPFTTPPAEKKVAAPTPPPVTTTPAAPVSSEAPATRPAEKVPATTAAGEVVHQVLPNVPDYARRTIRGTVKIHVRANVDASGHVTDAKVESQNSKYFAKLALEAARQWQFEGGPGDWMLRFDFTTGGTAVHPSRVGR